MESLMESPWRPSSLFPWGELRHTPSSSSSSPSSYLSRRHCYHEHHIRESSSTHPGMRVGRYFLFHSYSLFVALLLVLHLCNCPSYANQRTSVSSKTITYGSSIMLTHGRTSYRLFSGKISWGSGSGNQAVTALPGEKDNSVLWSIKEADGGKFKTAGTPVKCGDLIRLEHMDSEKNLHGQKLRSPISGHHEVSAFGSGGAGNSGDNFYVECVHSSIGDVWKTKDEFRLQHKELRGFLRSVHSVRFNHSNCPRCPIVGHLEVVVSNTSSPTLDDVWLGEQGVLVSNGEDDDDDDNDEDDEELRDEL